MLQRETISCKYRIDPKSIESLAFAKRWVLEDIAKEISKRFERDDIDWRRITLMEGPEKRLYVYYDFDFNRIILCSVSNNANRIEEFNIEYMRLPS